MTDENKNAVDEFLGDLKNNGQTDPFNEAPEDPFNQPKEEPVEEKKEEVVEEKVEEKPLPFHKDPKVLRFIEKEIEKRTKEPEVLREEPKDEPSDIDEVLTRIIGTQNADGTPSPERISAIKDFKRILLEREDRGAEKALERLQAERQAEARAEAEAEETLMNGFEAIEESNNVDITSSSPEARKLRAQFIDFVRKVAPKDTDGEILDYPDLEQTFEVFQSTRKATPSQTNRAKELASRSEERGTSTEGVKPTEPLSWGSEAWERLKESMR